MKLDSWNLRRKRTSLWRQPSLALGVFSAVGVAIHFLSLSLFLSHAKPAALWIFDSRTFAVAIAQLRHRRLRQRGAEMWNELKATEPTQKSHHFRSRFRFRVADDPLQGHDGVVRSRVMHTHAHTCATGAWSADDDLRVKFNWEQSRRNEDR